MGMGTIEVRIDKSNVKIDRKISELPSKMINLVEDISDVVEARMRDESPVRFGDLQNSHTTEVLSDLERWIGPTVAHAAFVVKGTRPHMIEGNPFLYWKGAKHPVRRVHHPGTKPNDYISRAKDQAEGRSSQLINSFIGWLTE